MGIWGDPLRTECFDCHKPLSDGNDCAQAGDRFYCTRCYGIRLNMDLTLHDLREEVSLLREKVALTEKMRSIEKEVIGNKNSGSVEYGPLENKLSHDKFFALRSAIRELSVSGKFDPDKVITLCALFQSEGKLRGLSAEVLMKMMVP
jgi:hypothetical protein